MLTQTEKLESCAPLSYAHEHEDEGPSVTIRDRCAKPEGWRMPSREAVRLHDARLSLNGSPVNVSDDEADEEEGEEGELYAFAVSKRAESMREHSFRLPSQRSRSDVRDALRFMNCGFGE